MRSDPLSVWDWAAALSQNLQTNPASTQRVARTGPVRRAFETVCQPKFILESLLDLTVSFAIPTCPQLLYLIFIVVCWNYRKDEQKYPIPSKASESPFTKWRIFRESGQHWLMPNQPPNCQPCFRPCFASVTKLSGGFTVELDSLLDSWLLRTMVCIFSTSSTQHLQLLQTVWICRVVTYDRRCCFHQAGVVFCWADTEFSFTLRCTAVNWIGCLLYGKLL